METNEASAIIDGEAVEVEVIAPGQSPDQQPAAAPVAKPVKISQEVAERIVRHYGRRVAEGERPVLILDDMIDGNFRADVKKKTYHLLTVVGQCPAMNGTDEENDDNAHWAMQRAAEAFKIKLRDRRGRPKPKPPQPPKPPTPPPCAVPAPAPAKSQQPDQEEQQQPQPGQGGGAKGQPKPQPAQPQPAQPQTQAGAPGGGEASEDESQDEPAGEDEGDGDGEETGEQGEGGTGSSREEHAKIENPASEKDEQPELEELDLADQKKAFKRISDFELPDEQASDMDRDDGRSGYTRFDFSATNGLMRALKAELASVAQCRKYPDRMNGELDIEEKCAAIAARTGLDRIYFNQTDARQLSAVVQIIIDTSSSTEGVVLQTECGLAHVIAECLERMHVPVQVLSFQGSPYLVKDFSERVADKKIPELIAGGSTHLPRAMARGAKDLAKRRERRKVQLVLTDGDTGWQANAQLEANLKQQNDYCVRNGFTAAQLAKTLSDYSSGADITTLQTICPGVETMAFGIGVNITPGVFDVAVSNLTTANMIEVVAQSLGRALVNPDN